MEEKENVGAEDNGEGCQVDAPMEEEESFLGEKRVKKSKGGGKAQRELQQGWPYKRLVSVRGEDVFAEGRLTSKGADDGFGWGV